MINDNPGQAAMPQPVAPASAPSVIVANKFALSVQATDFIMWAGTTRVAFHGNGEQAATITEYSTGLSLSPVAAKQLMTILNITVGKYEEAYGKIPVDPLAEQKFTALRKAKLNDVVEVSARPAVKNAPARAPAKKAPKKKAAKP